jgi:hypothetical protein
LGYFLDLLDLGTFEIKGGENAMIFLRINNPSRIEYDANNKNYSNTLLNKTLDRYHISNQIFDHFFLRNFSNEERWDFVKEYFLGENVDALLSKFNGNDDNKIDIIDYLKEHALIYTETKKQNSTIYFEPNPDKVYNQFDNLTLTKDEVKVTSQVFDWINQDPVLLDQAKSKFKLKFDKKVYSILDSKIKTFHPEYYMKKIGLNVLIEFRGYREKVLASIPYNEKPIEFYKWWCENSSKIYLSNIDKLRLFSKVHSLDAKILSYNDRNLLINNSK